MRHAGWWGLLLILTVNLASVASASEVDALLNKLVEKGLLTPVEAQDVRNDMGAEAKQREDQQKSFVKDAAKDVVPKWAQNVTWAGDFRLRYEFIQREGSPDRNRERIRLRYGLKAKVSDQLEVGVRLATGTAGDPVSTNQSFSSNFDKKAIFLDQAYLKFVTKGTPWEKSLPLTIWGGKFDSPFYSTSLVWDPDLTFEGAAVSLTPEWGPLASFTTVGIFPINEVSGDANDPVLYGAQTGLTWSVAPDAADEWMKNLKLKSAVAYYDFSSLKTGLGSSISSDFPFGNTLRSGTKLQFDYNEFNLTSEIASQWYNVPVRLNFDFVKNTAIPEDAKGYQIGLKLGKVDKPGSWEGGYFWQRLERDAVVGAFTDSDFGNIGGANRRGHVFYATLGTMKNSTVGFKWFLTQAVADPRGPASRFQLDWVTKF